MPEWCAVSLASPQVVRYDISLFRNVYKSIFSIGVYMLNTGLDGYGDSTKDAVIGQVRCVGTEPNLLECSYARVGFHACGNIASSDPDIIISCYGKCGFLAQNSYALLVVTNVCVL